MSYETIKAFTDKNANSAAEGGGAKHIYRVGDPYPFTKYAGATTKARLGELIAGNFIKEVPEDGK